MGYKDQGVHARKLTLMGPVGSTEGLPVNALHSDCLSVTCPESPTSDICSAQCSLSSCVPKPPQLPYVPALLESMEFRFSCALEAVVPQQPFY